MSFVAIDFESDPEDLEQQAYDFLRTRWPDWEPADGNLETWMIAAFARLVSEASDLAATVPTEVMKTFGAAVAGLPPEAAVPATGYTTWTMIDNLGYTVPAGTNVGIRDATGNLVAFATVDDFTVAPGDTTAAAILVRAVEEGAGGNDLSGTVDLIDSLNFIDGITLDAATAGGVDEESDTDYLDRLTEELQLSAPRPIVPSDFEVLARRINGVHRAVAVDGWNPTLDTLGNERYIGIALTDTAGEQPDPAVKTAVEDYLDGLREVNFVVEVGDPTYTTIDVDVTVTAYPAFDADDVEQEIVDALTAFFNPVNWGVPSYGVSNRVWVNTDVVRYLDVASVVHNVAGVDDITALTVEGASADVNLVGTVTLTRPGTITATVS